MTLLYDFYKDLLTEKQADCVDLYYNEDLSLAEISENLGITRQAVRDSIQRGTRALLGAEAKLELAARFDGIRAKVEKIDGIIVEIERSPGNAYLSDDIKRKINDILLIVKEIQEV